MVSMRTFWVTIIAVIVLSCSLFAYADNYLYSGKEQKFFYSGNKIEIGAKTDGLKIITIADTNKTNSIKKEQTNENSQDAKDVLSSNMLKLSLTLASIAMVTLGSLILGELIFSIWFFFKKG